MSAPYWVRSDETDRKEGEIARAAGKYYSTYSSARSHGGLSEAERHFVENRDRAQTLAESSDPNANYSYDDYALCELDGVFYVFNTSGCSCPSPVETWCLSYKGTREEIAEQLNGWKDDRYTSATSEFKREVAKVWPEVVAPDPSQRYDW